MGILADMGALLEGLWLTGRHLLRRPVTIQYPEERRPLPPRYRGRLILTRDPAGGERCVACQLCSAACPVDCIAMQPAELADGRRVAAWFRINFGRCIFCGLCAEACPTMALQMTGEFELGSRDIQQLVWEKEQLLVAGGGSDPDYDFYRHAGIGVAQPRGTGSGEAPPVDARGLMP